MTDQPEMPVAADLREARAWLNRAEQALIGAEDYASATDFAQAAAQIGTGYAQLAAIEALGPKPMFINLGDPSLSSVGSRPHDNEPRPPFELVEPPDASTCACRPDLCLAEADIDDGCRYCALADPELPCPIADADERAETSR